MRHYVTNVCLFVITLIVLFSICVLTCSAKMTQYLYDKEADIVISRGDEALANAQEVIVGHLHDSAIIATITAYSSLVSEMYDNDIQITEEAANDLFVKRYLDNLKKVYNADTNGMNIKLEKLLKQPSTGKLSMNDETQPFFVLDETGVIVKDITVGYSFEDSYSTERKFDVTLPIRRIVLFDENPEFFTYSLVAKKGIYITGKTSTIIGNIYAGTHEPTETRKAEALYGERDYYGGININATQLAVFSDKIVTDGAVNMKGSFVLFGSDESPTNIFAKTMTETDIIASRNMYDLKGKFEEIPDNFSDKNMVNVATAPLDLIDSYYDTINDGGYMGSYRKIISMNDITITEDVEGIVITPKNVIIEEGVNVAGIVIAGDRIYIQGNNNIVGSSDILRKIVKEELHENNVLEQEYMHIHASDYIGGIEARGIK